MSFFGLPPPPPAKVLTSFLNVPLLETMLGIVNKLVGKNKLDGSLKDTSQVASSPPLWKLQPHLSLLYIAFMRQCRQRCSYCIILAIFNFAWSKILKKPWHFSSQNLKSVKEKGFISYTCIKRQEKTCREVHFNSLCFLKNCFIGLHKLRCELGTREFTVARYILLH